MTHPEAKPARASVPAMRALTVRPGVEASAENDVVFGSVNANRRHYEAAARALAEADPDWLAGLITRRVPLAAYADALEKRDGDIKTVLTF